MVWEWSGEDLVGGTPGSNGSQTPTPEVVRPFGRVVPSLVPEPGVRSDMVG